MIVKTTISKISPFLRDIWRKSIFYKFILKKGPAPKHLTVVPTDPWPGDIHAGRLMLNGQFLLLNQAISMTDLWFPPHSDELTLAELHKFSWLRDLRALGDNSARKLARQLIVNWIDRNQDNRLAPWHVSITGHRIANWIALYDFFCASADERFRSLFFKELAKQVRHLTYSWKDAPTSLERLCALKGMVYAAVTFPQESHRLESILFHLEKEIQSQILLDGGHISRCSQTHLIVLADLIDIRAMLRLIHYEIPSFLQGFINQMAPIVRLFRHGDGGLATFGRPARVSPAVIDMVLSLADVRGRPPEQARNSGFERCVNKSSLVLVNVGNKIESSASHVFDEGTGSLNFEWSVGRHRFVLQGDLILQAKDGKYFQMPDLDNLKSIKLHRTSQKGHTLLDASYNAIDHLSFNHRRQLHLDSQHPNLKGEDTFQAPCEAAYGIRFVLGKEMNASLLSGKRGAIIRMPAHIKFSKNLNGHQWRLLVSGAEEILCETHDAHQTIILLGYVSANTPVKVQWAFCQN